MCGAAGADSLALLPFRATSSRPRSPSHEAVSAAAVQHLFVVTFDFVFAPILIRSWFHVLCDITQGGQYYNNPCSSFQCCVRKNVNSFSLEKTICIIVHAVQVYSNIQLWIIHIHHRVSNAYFAAVAASRITRSTLSGMFAYLALSSRAWLHESASLTLKSVLGRMRSSSSEGTMLSAWMSLAL